MAFDLSKTKILIYFDSYGNLYFKHNNTNYQVNIDTIPICEPIIDSILGIYKKVDTLTAQKQNLKEKIRQQLEEDENEYLDSDSDTESEPKDDSDSVDLDIINDYGENNRKFIFSTSIDIIKVFELKNSRIASLYNTCIYHNNELIFTSESYYQDHIYTIHLYTSGDIIISQVGHNNKTYKLQTTDTELFFK